MSLLKKLNNLDEINRYVIGDTLDDNLMEFLENDEVQLNLTQFKITLGKSIPNGKTNSALPHLQPYTNKNSDTKDPKKNNNGQSGENRNKSVDTSTLEKTESTSAGVDKSFSHYEESRVNAEEKEKKTADSNLHCRNIRIDTESETILNEKKVEIIENDVENSNCEARSLLDQIDDCIIRFEVTNNKTDLVRVEFEFNSCNDNYFCPCTPIIIQIPPMSSQHLITICKINPGLPWGNIDYQWKLAKPKQFDLKESTETFTENLDFFGLEDIGMNVSDFDDEVAAPTGKISCPRCTFYNDATDVKCGMCNFVLTKR